MRLIITGPASSQWARLEPETPEEARALEDSARRGEWTIGRGPEAGVGLQALAARLGHPVRATEHREAPTPPPPRLVVVQQEDVELAERLRELVRLGVPVISDRRERERRLAGRSVLLDRRRRDRRRAPPETWGIVRFLVVRDDEPPRTRGGEPS